MSFAPLMDYWIIGGAPLQRLVRATELRREGYSVGFEYVNRKRAKMYNKATEEAYEVIDLDKENISE